MGAFGDTVSLERSALKTVLSSSMLAGMYLPALREEWFTSDQRRFILDIAKKTMSDSRSLLTKQIFEFEAASRLTDKQQAYCLAEWDIIKEQLETDPIEAVIVKLREAYVGRQIITVTDDIATKLATGEIEEALSLLKQKAMSIGSTTEASPTVALYDVYRRLKIIEDKIKNPEKYMGIKIGFPSFDLRTGGIFRNEMTLIAGVTGQGKSTLIKQIAYNIVHLNAGVNVLHIANEEHLEQVEFKYDSVFTEVPYEEFKKATISDADRDAWLKLMRDNDSQNKVGKVFVKEVPAFTDVTLVEQAYRELEGKGIRIDVILIDHLPHIMPIMKAWGENDERGKAAADCKQLARFLHCAVVVPTQAATDVEKKQERGKRASKMDVYGSKAQVHVANTFIIITKRGLDGDDSMEDWQKDVLLLADVQKNRDGPPFPFGIRHRVKVGRMEEIDPELVGLPGRTLPASVSKALEGDDDDEDGVVSEGEDEQQSFDERDFDASDEDIPDEIDDILYEEGE